MRIGTLACLTIGVYAAVASAQTPPVVQVGAPLPNDLAVAPPLAEADIAPVPPFVPPAAAVPFAPAYAIAPTTPPMPFVGPVQRMTFGSVEALLFKVRPSSVPDLIFPTGAAQPGALNIDGNDSPNPFPGVRAQFGMWYDPKGCCGFDIGYMQLFQQSASSDRSAVGLPAVGLAEARALIDAGILTREQAQNSFQVGNVHVDRPVEVYSFDLNARRRGMAVLSDRVELFAGGRYLNLTESVHIDSHVTFANRMTNALLATVDSQESFRARNQFFGFQVGGMTRYDWGCFQIEFTGKLALGGVEQSVDVAGQATGTGAAGLPADLGGVGALLVGPGNSGQFSRGRLGLLSEFNARLGYRIRDNVLLTVGYDIVTLSSVQRAGAAVDRGVLPPNANLALLAGPGAAVGGGNGFSFHSSDFWAQGLNLGVAVSY